MRGSFAVAGWASLLLVAGTTGCGGSASGVPELASVEGRVTLAGKPLPEAVVIFEPTTGAISTGVTDAEGYFKLLYSGNRAGAVVGRHTVKISKFDGEAGDELIPRQYNDASTLIQEVSQGPNDVLISLN
jgi:hypothetical protein